MRRRTAWLRDTSAASYMAGGTAGSDVLLFPLTPLLSVGCGNTGSHSTFEPVDTPDRPPTPVTKLITHARSGLSSGTSAGWRSRLEGRGRRRRL